MKISPINNENYAKNSNLKSKSCANNFISRQNKLERSFQRDSVNFMSRPIEVEKILDNKNTGKGLKIAKEVLTEICSSGSFSLKSLEKIVQKNHLNSEVRPMKELGHSIPNAEFYKAYSSSNFDEAFNRIDFKMYIDMPKSRQEIPAFISDVSHECTHLSQDFNSAEDISIIKQASKGDRPIAETLKELYECSFNAFGANIPTYMSVIKEKDGRNLINSHLKSNVRQLLSQIVNGKDPKRENHILSVYSNVDDLIFDVKHYCGLKSKQEKEAYATEYALSKRLNPRNSNNYKEAVQFFSDLEDAFKVK